MTRISSVVNHNNPLYFNTHHLPKPLNLNRTGLSFKRTYPAWHHLINSSLKSTTSEEASSGETQYVKEETDGVVMIEDVERDEQKESYGAGYVRTFENESDGAQVPSEEFFKDEQFQPFDILDKLDLGLFPWVIKKGNRSQLPRSFTLWKLPLFTRTVAMAVLELDSPYPLLVYGVGSLITLWLTSAVVASIDSIPVFPKLMEVIGLGYSLWFATRYLLFKKNRDELVAKIEEIKQEVLGSIDD